MSSRDTSELPGQGQAVALEFHVLSRELGSSEAGELPRLVGDGEGWWRSWVAAEALPACSTGQMMLPACHIPGKEWLGIPSVAL